MNSMPTCHNCGGSQHYMAKASRGGETRYFCHTVHRSCYNERRGSYWDDDVIMTLDPAEAKVTVEDGVTHLEVTLTETHLKHLNMPRQRPQFSIGTT